MGARAGRGPICAQLWSGAFHQRCVEHCGDALPVAAANAGNTTVAPVSVGVAVGDFALCGGSAQCSAPQRCVHQIEQNCAGVTFIDVDWHAGLISFDNLWTSLLTVYRVSTLSWVDIMYELKDTVPGGGSCLVAS